MMSSACLPHIFKEDEMRIFVKSKNTIVSGKGLFNWILGATFLFSPRYIVGLAYRLESVQLNKSLKMRHFSSILNKNKKSPISYNFLFYSKANKNM